MKRNLGLDITRATAIILVLICHALGFFFTKYFRTDGISYVTGYLGVEVFFVLSGFLIGKILIKDVYEGANLHGLKRFYLRRWLRTLPVYFFVVLILILLGRHFYWQNLLFIQNFQQKTLEFMPVSWSLSIEEWFYLLIPIIFIVSGFLSKNYYKDKVFIILCLLLIILDIYFRLKVVETTNPVWDFGVRKQIFLRMDSLLIGVLLAGIKNYYNKVYEFISRSIVIQILSLATLSYYGGFYVYNKIMSHTIDYSKFSRVYLFIVISLCIAILISHLENSFFINLKITNMKLRNIIQFISVTSYSAYLIHFDVYMYYGNINNRLQGRVFISCFICLFSLVVIYTISFAIYRCIETPILKYRNKIT